MGSVIGRERELAAIETCLDAAREGHAALLIAGDAGIGKTTVWRQAVRLGGERGFRVLACRPAEAETKLAYASLTDLLATVESAVLDELPEPQRHALAVALLRESPRVASTHSRAVGAAVVSVLHSLAASSPVLVAIDDVQWLDRASASVLAFAVRRLEGYRVAVVVAERFADRGPADGLQLERGGAAVVRLGPLSLSSLYHVIRDGLGLLFPRPTLQRIGQASGGNPLFALELAQALDAAGGRPSPYGPLPVPAALVDLMRDRVGKLPPRTQDALVVVASLSAPSPDLLERAGVADDLQPAVRQGIVDLTAGVARFQHPLLAEAVLSSSTPERRRAVHRRLAGVVEQTEERARHLALATDAPDEATAARLEEASEHASRRGAPETAAELLELACRRTPDADPAAADRRTIALARALHRVGDTPEARRRLEIVLSRASGDGLRAQALELLAQIHWVDGSADVAAALCEEALALVADDVELRARVLTTLARVSMNNEAQLERAQAAVELLEASSDPDPALLSEALLCVCEASLYLGRGLPAALVERGLELERVAPPVNVSDRFSAALGTWLKYSGDFEGARYWLERTLRAAQEEGDEGSLPFALGHLPQLELWVGDWKAAEARALEHLERAERTGQATERLTAIYNLTSVLAHRGRTDDARTRIEQALPDAERTSAWSVYQLVSTLGFLELSLGNIAQAVQTMERAYDVFRQSGSGHLPFLYENYAEALVLDGSLARAEDLVDAYEARARERGQPMTLAPALRCRALLAAAEGDLDVAADAVEEALENGRRVNMPFGLARTLIVQGQVLRRRGERRASRDALERALATVEELGAPLWAELARAELARVPIKRRSGAALTPAEERVAQLVAQGRTNQEVAQALFVSKKTVEANLTRVYRKLGVRSRAALVARLQSRKTEDEAAKL